jgi:hypothetical protein
MKNFTEYQLQVLEQGEVDCIDVVKLMGDYHDEELPESLRGRLHAHIKKCSICSEMYSGYSFVVELAKELQDEPMPRSAKSRLRESLNERLGLELAAG